MARPEDEERAARELADELKRLRVEDVVIQTLTISLAAWVSRSTTTFRMQSANARAAIGTTSLKARIMGPPDAWKCGVFLARSPRRVTTRKVRDRPNYR